MLLAPSECAPAWLLVRSKPKQEKLALETLGSRGIAVYCPRVLEPRIHRNSPVNPVPLFPSYLFARFVLAEQFAPVNYCPGVQRVVRFGDRFAGVEDEVVAVLREREGDRGYFVFERPHLALGKGKRVRIVSGPLAGYEGLVEEYLPSRDRVRLLLKLVTGTWRAQVRASLVRCA
jgi:transcriptional antiterminator RfaH